MNRFLNIIMLLLLGAVAFSACNKKDPEPENPEELITTVRLTFKPVGGGTDIIATWQDLDGDGGMAPTVSPSTVLAQGTTYSMTVELWNESVNPDENITTEIAAEDEDHQFFFTTSNLPGLQIAYDDLDANQKPVGLTNKVTTPSSNVTGTLTVILRHLPNKSATGVASGDITNAGGETDIETTPPFNITVQ